MGRPWLSRALETTHVQSQIIVVQSAVKDSAPSNLDSYQNGASQSGSPQFGLSQSLTYGSNTASGNALICFATCAMDLPQNLIFSCTDPVNGAWTQIGDLQVGSPCNCDIKTFVKFNASPMLTTSWSGTGAVSSGGVLTIGSGSGAFRIGQRIASASTPPPVTTGGGSMTGSHGGDVVVASLLSGSLGANGSTYQLGGSIGATTFASEAMTTTDIINITRSQVNSITDYPGIWAAELSGTDGSTTYYNGNHDTPAGSGTDTVTSGNLTMAASPGLLIGFCENGGVNNGSAGSVVPGTGTGFTNSLGILTWDSLSWTGPICKVEWQHFASLGTRAATFSPNAASDYATVAIGFLDHP